MRKAVIFDLDGTLTQSEEGIWNSVLFAADQMGFERPDAATLRKFVGPPLVWSFMTYMGMREEQANEAIAHYRSRYNVTGLFENRVYPGIRRLLHTLTQQGYYCAVATGKPQETARRVIAHFGLDQWLSKVIGPDHSAPEKDYLIRAALPEDYDEAWMVGDRKFDMEGGRKVGIHTVGAGYGYGSEEELRTAGCDFYAATVQDLIDYFCPDAVPPKGAFLSIEGVDGSGKSTQIKLLTDALDRFGYEVVHSREPGGCFISEKIRDVLLDRANVGMTPVTEALLYAASRAQHVQDVILPTMKAGKVLLCDRFVDSSVAYQGGGRQLGVQGILDINAPAVDGCMPLATVYLAINHTVAMQRRLGASEPDRMEMEADSFHARVQAAYEELIQRDPARFVVVDATQKPEDIGKAAAGEVIRRLMEEERNG